MKIVYVTWIDSSTDDGWQDANELDERPDLVHSVGFLVKETDTLLVIANSYDPATGHSNGRMSIPLVSIQKVKTIK